MFLHLSKNEPRHRPVSFPPCMPEEFSFSDQIQFPVHMLEYLIDLRKVNVKGNRFAVVIAEPDNLLINNRFYLFDDRGYLGFGNFSHSFMLSPCLIVNRSDILYILLVVV